MHDVAWRAAFARKTTIAVAAAPTIVRIKIGARIENVPLRNSADLGRIEVDGDHLFINNVNPECVTSDQQVLELHHDYIDVHILLEGEEMIGWKALEDLQNETKAYSKEEDCALYSDRPTTYVSLLPGQFVIVYPEDPHAPVIGSGKIRKLIAKVKL